MKKLSKKLLAILLTLAMLAVFPVANSVSAETDEAALKEALITAWNNLEYTQGDVLGYPPNAKPIEEHAEALSSLSAEQMAKLGTHVGIVLNNAGASLDFPSRRIGDYETLTLAMYSGRTSGVQFTYTMSLTDGSTIKKDGGWTSNAVFTERELSTDYGNTNFVKDEHSNAGFSGMSMSANTYQLYVGCIMGWKKVNETAPENAENMTAKELYEEASKLDLTKYDNGTEAFETALTALYAVAYPEAAALIEAWNTLEYNQSTTLGYRDGAKPVEDYASELAALTPEQIEKIGTHVTKVTAQGFNDTSYVVSDRLGNYDKITQVIYTGTTSNTQIPFIITFSNGQEISGYPWTGGEGFFERDFTSAIEPYKEYSLKNVRFSVTRDGAASYIGSLVGWKTVKETAPDNAAVLSEKELYALASKLDLTKYINEDGVAAFEAALDDLYAVVYPEAAALIEAWGNLSYEQYETLAYPTRVAVAAAGLKEELLAAGATEEQIAKFGTHIAKFTENKTSAEWSATTSVTTPATSYKKICFSAYSVGSTGIRYAIRGTNSKYNEGSYAYSEGYKELDITSKVSGWGESALNDFRPYKESGTGTVYIGAVVGVKDVNESAPADAMQKTLTELYAEASEVATDKYTDGVEEFEAAKAALANILYAKVTVAAENGAVTGLPTLVEKGKELTLTAVADKGYEFAGWFVDGVKVCDTADYTFTPDGDVTVTAQFELQTGDLEDDNVIDSKDVAAMRSLILSGAAYNAAADMDSNSVVDILDLVILSKMI